MQEIVNQILGHVRAAWRYRWHMLLVAWLVCVVGWIIVASLPNQYQATARVYVDTRSILRPLLKGLAVDVNAGQQVELMTRTLLSRPNLEKVARMSDLDLRAKDPKDMEDLLDRLRGTITLSGTERENLYIITYTNESPQVAKRVVQSLLTIFVENSLGETRQDTDTAQHFLDEQIKEYEARLVAAEERLKEFKQKNVGRLPQEGADYYQSLQSAQQTLEQAQLQYREVRNRRDELKRQMQDSDTQFSFSAPAPATAAALDGRIQALQAKLDDMLLRYTPQHPDVLAVKRTIEDLEKQKQSEIKAASKKSSGSQGETNPVLAQMRASVAEAEAQVAAMQARVDEYQRRVQQLRGMVNVIPEVETQMTQLNRDYAVNKQNYETLLARRESAMMSEQADQTSGAVKFKVIDPPFVPLEPSGPNRPLMTSITLLAGLGVGIAFAMFLSQIFPTFDSRRALLEATGLPVLGGVSMVWTPEQLRQMRLASIGFFTVVGVLVVAYGGIFSLEIKHVDFWAKIASLTGKVI